MTRKVSNWLNDVPRNWEKMRLKDVGYLYGGLTGKSGDDFQSDDLAITKPYIPFTNILIKCLRTSKHTIHISHAAYIPVTDRLGKTFCNIKHI